MPFSTNVMGVNNLIENGTFDTSMDSWNAQTSENFTITSDAGVCNVNTTHTDWMSDINSTLLNATTYNMTVGSGDPSGEGLTHYAGINSTSYELMNDTFDNYSYNGWEYDEGIEVNSLFLRNNISTVHNLSYPSSMSIQSRRMQNISFLNDTFDDEPDMQYSGFGDEKFIWNETDERLDCTWSRNAQGYPISSAFADAYYPIYTLTEDNSFGANLTIYSNESYSPDLYSLISIAFFNASDENHQINSLKSFISVSSTTNYVLYSRTYDSEGGFGISGGGFSSQIKQNLNYGLLWEIWYDAENHIFKSTLKNRTTHFQWCSFSIVLDPSSEFTIDSFGVISSEGFYITPPQNATIKGYIDNVDIYVDTFGLDNSGSAITYKTGSITNSSVRIDIETNRLHYHDAQHGIVSSSISIDTSEGQEVLDTAITTSTSSWINTQDTIRNVSGEYNLSTLNYFTLTEGSANFPAKSVNYDNISILATEYSENASYTSQVFDRGHYADWEQLVLFFNGLEGEYTIPMFPAGWDTIFNVVAYTRVGYNETIDGTWSNWEETISQTYSLDDDLLKLESTIPSKNGQFVQYRMEIEMCERGFESSIFLYGNISSVPIIPSTEWGSFTQDIIKPYSNYTTLKYDYKIHELNNTINGTIQVSFGNTLINQHNYSITETAWKYIEVDLPNIYNSSGTYNLNFTVITNFNSTNGTSTIFFDNVEILIEEQAPTITSFNIYNTTSKAIFNGTFKDLTIGSDYEYLGMDGIDSVNITIGNTVLDITDYQYIGNGSFEFNYVWSNIPFEMEEIELNATLTVKDTSDLEGTDISSITFPNTSTVLTFLIAQVFIIIIVFVLIRYFYLIWCDSDHDGKKDKECKI